MKAPSKVPPYYNLKNTMDLGCWISVPVSLISVSLALVIIVRVGKSYGIPQPDLLRIILTPFAMMNHEEMPAWFEVPRSPVNRNRSLIEVTIRLVRRGRAGNLLLLMWSYMGMIIMFGFTCNLRAIYMKENFETPLKTAEQIYKSDKTYYDVLGKEPLYVLDNIWYQKKARSVEEEDWHELYEKLNTDENIVLPVCDGCYGCCNELRNETVNIDNIVLIAPVRNKPPTTHYIELSSFIMEGWMTLEKMSPWKRWLDTHILQLDQVN